MEGVGHGLSEQVQYRHLYGVTENLGRTSVWYRTQNLLNANPVLQPVTMTEVLKRTRHITTDLTFACSAETQSNSTVQRNNNSSTVGLSENNMRNSIIRLLCY